jgi:hypothetical protein
MSSQSTGQRINVKYLKSQSTKIIIILFPARFGYSFISNLCFPFDITNSALSAVCETKFCGIIDQSLFYIDLAVHYIQNFEYLT